MLKGDFKGFSIFDILYFLGFCGFLVGILWVLKTLEGSKY